jgi:hypothetical protein
VAAIFVIGVILFVLFAALGKGGGGQYDRLLKNGIPARGILLRVASTGTKSGTPQRRFEQRQVYVDIEIPGRAPYETSASPYIPINLVRDVLPGATVELRVDPKNPNVIAIVGPGVGFVQSMVRTS